MISNLFSTWSDAPGGFSGNLKQLRYSVYAETVLQRVFAIRAGYAYENANYGNRNYISMGAGINWDYQDNTYTFNLSYQQPLGANSAISPLRNALALQFIIQFGKR